MIEKVLNSKNIHRAIRQIVSNKGAAGVDGMHADQLRSHVLEHRNKLFTQIIHQRYVPNAIKGIVIPKSNGKERLLGFLPQ